MDQINIEIYSILICKEGLLQIKIISSSKTYNNEK